MIIANDIYPTWTNRDVIDANAHTEQRYKLWLANQCAALWPQVFSWMVVNIYPADTTWDYRFESHFANKAILVTFDWDSTGRGCSNASCYRTYPKGRMCTRNDPPTLFPSGENTDVIACQPACYMKGRLRDLHKHLPKNSSLIDKMDPRLCTECNYLSPMITNYTRIRRLDGRYELYNWQNGSRFLEAGGALDIGTPVRVDNKQNLQTDTDMPFLMWDHELKRCIIPYESLYQKIVEPWWRDPSHSICRLTNFRHGNDPVWGYRPKHIGQTDPRDFSFLVKHSRTYCRAFGKEWNDKEGSCEQTLFDKIFSYTLAGDALIRWVKRLVDGDWGCADDKWVPIEGERTREADPTTSKTANYYVSWRGDINRHFKLPPPNVLLSDLGIDVRLTGNRLYWNSHEGIISQFPLFNGVTSYYTDKLTRLRHRRHGKFVAPDTDSPPSLYRNYNLIFYKKALCLTKSKKQSLSGDQLSTDNKKKIHDSQNIEDMLAELASGLQEKKTIIETRWREKRDSLYALRADYRDKPLDGRIKSQIKTLQGILSKRDLISLSHDDANNILQSDTASIPYLKNLPEYLTEQYLAYYLRDDKPASNDHENIHDNPIAENGDKNQHHRYPRSNQAGKQRIITPASHAKHNEIAALIDHINDNSNQNKFWAIMQELGIGVSASVGEVLLKKALRHGYKKLLRLISYQSSGKINLALLKVGVRVANARIAGIIGARLTTRALMVIGSFSSGVGAIIGATQLLSLVFDIAGLSGWDPGNYNSETDLAIYRDLADFFNYTKESISRGPLTPFEAMQLLTSVNEPLENSEYPDESGEQHIDTADNKQSQAIAYLHVDRRVSVAKWFNNHWPRCFKKPHNGQYLAINDDHKSWAITTLFDYLGSLKTNSYGQHIAEDPLCIRLNQDDLASLFIEADYRDLTTIIPSGSVDNRDFNQRATSSGKMAGLLCAGSLISLIFGLLSAARGQQSYRASLAVILSVLVLSFIVVLLALYFSLALLPISGRHQNRIDNDNNDNKMPVDSSGEPGKSFFTTEEGMDKIRTIANAIR